MTKPSLNAETYFEKLWQDAKVSLKNGTIPPAEMVHGHTVPINYCLSTVARLSDQPKSPLSKLEAVMDRLRSRLADQFFYDRHALHISLLGCTPRLAHPSMFEDPQKEKIQEICSRLLQEHGVIDMHLRGVGLVGNQVFVQVYPQNNVWAQLRQRLDDELRAAGEQPISHPDKRPIHLNIMRITNLHANTLPQLQTALHELHDEDIGPVTIRFIEYLIADFVLSDTTPLSSIDLMRPSN